MIFATITLTKLLFFASGVFYRLLPNKHNTNINHASVAEADWFALLSHAQFAFGIVFREFTTTLNPSGDTYGIWTRDLRRDRPAF